MEMYTSYYAAVSHMDTSDALLVQISNSAPKWFTKPLYKLKEAIPDWSIVSSIKEGRITEQQYEASYAEQLSGFNQNNVRGRLITTARQMGYSRIIFLCWETKYKFCHRHQFNNWIGGNGEL